MLISFKPLHFYVPVHGSRSPLVPTKGLFHVLLWDVMLEDTYDEDMPLLTGDLVEGTGYTDMMK